ncbi:Peptidase C39 family protein [Fodinibius roseus]|uniref:Peptidase C39 family protein n=1 Tax=Fodinibius roseus TaxID=1194090 RepID=A0A1M4SDG9_9BACT|nr:cysteine peptidase family C39 domain-containing protein [Fodinibius roseus]SHE30246.1 Peptidase C39 family protein [Fodinibius roseus]
MNTSKIYRQYDAMDCGPTCLRMVAKHYGRSYTMDTVRGRSDINRESVL